MSGFNKVILMGNLTADPDVSVKGETKMAKFTVAVQRNFKDKDGNYGTDFVRSTAFGKTADFLEKYFKKGSNILVEGEWRTDNYKNKNGDTVYTNDCSVSKVHFAGGKSSGTSHNDSIPAPDTQATMSDDFVEVDMKAGGDIPFFSD